MKATSRTSVLDRYRHLRKLNIRHQTAALKNVSTSALLAQGKRLGLASGKTLTTDDDDDLTFVFDLALHAAPPGRSRAIDRYAHSIVGQARAEDIELVQAMQAARFSLWRVERRHEVAGLVLRDLLYEEDWWVVDEGLEASASDGLCLALRLFRTPDGFAMSCGALAGLDTEMVDPLFDLVGHLLDRQRLAATADRRFAETLYKFALCEKHFGEMLPSAA